MIIYINYGGDAAAIGVCTACKINKQPQPQATHVTLGYRQSAVWAVRVLQTHVPPKNVLPISPPLNVRIKRHVQLHILINPKLLVSLFQHIIKELRSKKRDASTHGAYTIVPPTTLNQNM